jgi:5-dehydro-4-deoxyglucarate dehydratase
VHPLYAIRERMRGYEVAVTKKAMEMLGRHAGSVRPPLTACRTHDVDDLKRVMQVYRDVIDQRESAMVERSPMGAGWK